MKDILQNLQKHNAHLPEDRIYVHFDKTIYELGDTIWFTAYVRDGQTLKKSKKSAWVTIELRNPKGSVEQEHKIILVDGMAKGDFYLKKNWSGGLYQIRAVTSWIKNDKNPAVFVKDITVQHVVLPRLKMKLEFERKAYGQGDDVVAKLSVEDNTNEPLRNYPLNYTIRLQGKDYHKKSSETDDNGQLNLRFSLPKNLSTTDCLVNVLIKYQGQTESISRAVPIVLNVIKMEFYPEGGDLVNEFSSKVAFKAVNEFGKAADVEGIIINQKGETVTTFNSFHYGMGSFNIIPRNGEIYKAEITKPKGIKEVFTLPQALMVGHTLGIEKVTETEITIQVQSGIKEIVHVVGNIRGKNYFVESFETLYSSKSLTIDTEDLPIGVLHLTLFNSEKVECAERLVFVNTHRQLNIDISTDKTQYLPREKVNMTLKATDNEGNPIPANLSVSVVDDQLLNFIDDQSSHMLSWLLMENDIATKVENPQFYFDENEPKSEKARDYLLMTAGWRRFTWQQIKDGELPKIKHKKDKKILRGQVSYYSHNRPIRPLRRAKVQIGRKTTYTKKDGSFTLEGFDINENTTIEITKWRHNIYQDSIKGYFDNYEASLYRKRSILSIIWGIISGLFWFIIWLIFRWERAARGVMNALSYSAMDMNVSDRPDIRPKSIIQSDVQRLSQKIDMEEQVEFDEHSYHYHWLAGDFYWGREFPKIAYENKEIIKKRTDFRTTIYWNGKVKLDKNGSTTLTFFNGDLISSFRITTEGMSKNGLLGRATQQYFTQLPFSLSTKLPSQVVVGDLIEIPLTLVNNTATTITGQLSVKAPNGLLPKGKLPNSITLESNTALTEYLAFDVLKKGRKDKLKIEFVAEDLSDSIEKDLTIVNNGFPVNISFSSSEMSAVLQKDFMFSMDNIINKSLHARFFIETDMVKEMAAACSGMIRQPYGCFEQTSSSTYPNILILQYLELVPTIADKETIKRAKSYIKDGYKRLMSFESKSGGFEWFGGNPGHEGLTAYGLMEFVEMQRVYDDVSIKMIQRTAKWLLSRRNGNGGFGRNQRALHSFGAADNTTMSLYITWALSEIRMEGLEKEIDFAYNEANKSQNPYHLGLAANVLFNYGELEKGDVLVKSLLRLQNKKGSWNNQPTFASATGSRRMSLSLETAALAALAILKSTNKHHPKLKLSLDFMKSQKSYHGMFGSTNSTVLVLKAILEYSKQNQLPKESGILEIVANGQTLISQNYSENGNDGGNLNQVLTPFLQEGDNELTVEFSKTDVPLPYNIGIDYWTSLPPKSPDCAIQLAMQLKENEVMIGETVRLSILIKNKTDENQAMTVAIIGLPAGLSLQPWQLKQLLDENKFDFYELKGNRLVLYYRGMAANDVKRIDLDLKADIAGRYQSPASCAYLYYTDEFKDWTILENVDVNY